MFILYDLFFILFLLVYFPYFLLKGKLHRGLFIRMGIFPEEVKANIGKKKNIWIHAVSVGEVLAVENLIKVIKEQYSGYQVIVSTVTETGNKIAKEKSIGDIVLYAPFDLSWTTRQFIRLISPEIYISAETEIWPNIYTSLNKLNVPIIQVNGRISDKSFSGYKKISFVTKKVLSFVSVFCVQSNVDRDRIVALGANQGNCFVAGNMKFDGLDDLGVEDKKSMGFRDEDELFVLGSTHPGEEEIIIDIFSRLKEEFKNLKLVIAPRHVHRVDDILEIAREKGYHPVKYSQISEEDGARKDSIVIIDGMGHLRKLYSIATMVFIGKTFCVGGGQNMIEPAAFGKPIVVGPYTQNFKDVIRSFLENKAIVQVHDEEELYNAVLDILKDSQKRELLGSNAKEVVRKSQGATSLTLKKINGIISPR